MLLALGATESTGHGTQLLTELEPSATYTLGALAYCPGRHGAQRSGVAPTLQKDPAGQPLAWLQWSGRGVGAAVGLAVGAGEGDGVGDGVGGAGVGGTGVGAGVGRAMHVTCPVMPRV